jgi:hypothetical protein
MSFPEYKAKIYANRDWSKISKKRYTDNPQLGINQSARMKANNPSQRPDVQEKIKTTKRINGTLHVWKGERGGNGKLTEPQQRLAIALGWPTEVAISLGKRKSGYPTCYKVDVGNEKLKIAIEVDGAGHQKKQVAQKDRKKEKMLNLLGWTVLRFTNREILTALNSVLENIQCTISK